MTNRFVPLLDRLAGALLLGAIVAPLLFAMVQTYPGRPRVQRMVANAFTGPVMGIAIQERFYLPWAFSVFGTNAGSTES